MEEELSDLLTAEVAIRLQSARGRGGAAAASSTQQGEVAIRFGSLDALEGLLERLRRMPR